MRPASARRPARRAMHPLWCHQRNFPPLTVLVYVATQTGLDGMSDEREYLFKIDVYTPSTLPMRRLAEYMFELARLLGEYDHVHFKRLRKGSAVLESHVDFVAVPKVRARVRAAAIGEAGDIRRTWQKIDQMLASDNATGSLSEKGHENLVLRFPGRETASDELGPFSQEGSIQGVLVSIGGEDNTAHARLQDGDD